jgi:hypothetical protein
VSGIVTYDGRPLPSGTVLFHGENGRVEHALISPDGAYTIAEAPQGAVRITVHPHASAPLAFPTRGKPPPQATENLPSAGTEKRDGKFVDVPSRYRDPDSSGLTFEVRAGSQKHDIDLRP